MRIRAVTLLETLVALALVGLVFAILIPLLQLGGTTLTSATRAALTTEQISYRTILRGTFQQLTPLGSFGFRVRGDTQSITYYSHAEVEALPEMAVRLVSISLEETTARVTQVALSSDQSVLSEETQVFDLGVSLSISYLPPCGGPNEWQDVLEGFTPFAVELEAEGSGFWPDFVTTRPLAAADGC